MRLALWLIPVLLTEWRGIRWSVVDENESETFVISMAERWECAQLQTGKKIDGTAPEVRVRKLLITDCGGCTCL